MQQQQDILARLAKSVGAKAANPALRNSAQANTQSGNLGQQAQSTPYYPGRAQQPTPQQANSYPAPSYNGYAQQSPPQQQIQSRGSARTRR